VTAVVEALLEECCWKTTEGVRTEEGAEVTGVEEVLSVGEERDERTRWRF
jgi:hypothetical protein